MIVVGGMKVYLVEVESVLFDLLFVKDVVVVGVLDVVMGEKVVVFVVLELGELGDDFVLNFRFFF